VIRDIKCLFFYILLGLLLRNVCSDHLPIVNQIVFSVLLFLSSWKILDISLLLDEQFANICSHFTGCLLTLVDCFLFGAETF
jgi:hypothetical protein